MMVLIDNSNLKFKLSRLFINFEVFQWVDRGFLRLAKAHLSSALVPQLYLKH